MNWRRYVVFSLQCCRRSNPGKQAYFSDECSIQNICINPTSWIWRDTSEAYHPKYVNVGGSSRPQITIMVWAAIWKGGRSPLVIMTRDVNARKRGFTSQSYIQALQEGLIPFYDETCHFMQDNAPIHGSAAVEAFLLNHKISILEWPPYSPDLNPIEHVWRMLKHKLHKLFPELFDLRRNLQDIKVFKECLQKAWAALDQNKISALIDSVERRRRQCMAAKGWWTKY